MVISLIWRSVRSGLQQKGLCRKMADQPIEDIGGDLLVIHLIQHFMTSLRIQAVFHISEALFLVY
ncbi:hypothetical protein D3C80_2039890 [compost metagenome]